MTYKTATSAAAFATTAVACIQRGPSRACKQRLFQRLHSEQVYLPAAFCWVCRSHGLLKAQNYRLASCCSGSPTGSSAYAWGMSSPISSALLNQSRTHLHKEAVAGAPAESRGQAGHEHCEPLIAEVAQPCSSLWTLPRTGPASPCPVACCAPPACMQSGSAK